MQNYAKNFLLASGTFFVLEVLKTNLNLSWGWYLFLMLLTCLSGVISENFPAMLCIAGSGAVLFFSNGGEELLKNRVEFDFMSYSILLASSFIITSLLVDLAVFGQVKSKSPIFWGLGAVATVGTLLLPQIISEPWAGSDVPRLIIFTTIFFSQIVVNTAGGGGSK